MNKRIIIFKLIKYIIYVKDAWRLQNEQCKQFREIHFTWLDADLKVHCCVEVRRALMMNIKRENLNLIKKKRRIEAVFMSTFTAYLYYCAIFNLGQTNAYLLTDF